MSNKKSNMKKYEFALLNIFLGAGYLFIGAWKRTLMIIAAIAILGIVAGVTMLFSKFLPMAAVFCILGILGYSAYDGWKKGT